MNSAGQLLHFSHHYCAAHVIELTARLAFNIDDEDDTLSGARKLVGHFKGSTQANARLLDLQDNSAGKKVTVIADVATRWWYTYAMCE